uniref:Uncharacterized protein n=1 Tax=Anguilla anguilla TaxID=7936 RepID=A0A0E9SS39_ANGAN
MGLRSWLCAVLPHHFRQNRFYMSLVMCFFFVILCCSFKIWLHWD